MTVQNPGLLWTVLSFVLLIGPLVFIHEMGHYLAGRWCGVKADVFSIGFGRELIGWDDRRGTRWKVSALPLGGYVKFAGDMNPGSQPDPKWLALPPEERAQTFQAKAIWQKLIIIAAGPAANFLFAIAVFAVLFGTYGVPRTPAIAGSVMPQSAAEQAGIQPGDRILSVGGRTVERFEDIQEVVSIRPATALDLEYSHKGRIVSTTVTTGVDIRRDNFGNEARIGLLGLTPAGRAIVPLKWYQVPGEAVGYTWAIVKVMVVTTKQLILGERSVKEMAGPIGMARLAGQQATLGWLDFVTFMTLISINLGFINLLPVPMLDGGHLLFYTLEGLRGRPIGQKVQEWAFRSGLALLLALMMFVTLNDLNTIGLWRGIAGLIAEG
ncbi:RIP metalloprotease RseP [Sphingomonas sp. ID0503]|uniref:RIP metalloprotease RseP n=1 Tax=Sphingomonas sp. ID0503 TaxID=3399691 RepID=UPI003AFAA564